MIHPRLYIKWWKTWKGVPVYAWLKAASYYKNGEFNRAAELYEAGLKKYSDHNAHYCARLDLAHCYFRLQKFDEAEHHLKYVVSKLPRSREGHRRLAKLYLWTGRSLDAAWTLRRATRQIPGDATLTSLFLFSVIENGGPNYLMKEAVDAAVSISGEDNSPLLEATRARVALEHSSKKRREVALDILMKNTEGAGAKLESLILFADYLLQSGEMDQAQKLLRRALRRSPSHPRVQAMLAHSYLKSGDKYNSGYALQLALSACQSSGWLSPREMHVLAEAYFHHGDKMAALIVASKAQEEGKRLLGAYRDADQLERLIQDLSSGTQA